MPVTKKIYSKGLWENVAGIREQNLRKIYHDEPYHSYKDSQRCKHYEGKFTRGGLFKCNSCGKEMP